MRPWTDEELKVGFLDELRALIFRSPTVTATMTPVEAWAIVSHLQLALRHPGAQGPSSQIARTVAERMAATLAVGPAMREVLRRGWDPAHDLPLRFP